MISRSNKGLLRILRYTRIDLNPTSRMSIEGYVTLGTKQVKGSRLETRILLEDHAKLTIKDSFEVFAGSYIRVVKGGHLILHEGFINENVQITCGATIEIGRGATIGRDVVIRSYDGHYIERENYHVSNSIHIGENVWIGQRAMILKGVTIGDGCIISAGAIVTSDIPAYSLVAGVPAKVIKENIKWHR